MKELPSPFNFGPSIEMTGEQFIDKISKPEGGAVLVYTMLNQINYTIGAVICSDVPSEAKDVFFEELAVIVKNAKEHKDKHNRGEVNDEDDDDE